MKADKSRALAARASLLALLASVTLSGCQAPQRQSLDGHYVYNSRNKVSATLEIKGTSYTLCQTHCTSGSLKLFVLGAPPDMLDFYGQGMTDFATAVGEKHPEQDPKNPDLKGVSSWVEYGMWCPCIYLDAGSQNFFQKRKS